eukprot:CAMPEP_0181248388 /NCGR_PEP_ID=MMETSP1096-20121128/45139_1 /TAXON_ID=156174 ORGANISM="Chrysochromulina ericina, Strain CCMP281" /NCGR_SAMPLE_ID=MMETSP1096 /ASSEMBLY_ACC=CAM_ASM_000453 /LENGTH=131 /DNA_ID=CAMNT_0023345545 /DNA_START=641 /DNA_END=1033 /DNA_ORIENTATION=-
MSGSAAASQIASAPPPYPGARGTQHPMRHPHPLAPAAARGRSVRHWPSPGRCRPQMAPVAPQIRVPFQRRYQSCKLQRVAAVMVVVSAVMVVASAVAVAAAAVTVEAAAAVIEASAAAVVASASASASASA